MHLLVFDIDGTLTRTNEVDSDCFVAAIREVLGLEEIETDWTNYQFVTDSGIAQEVSHRYRERPLSGAEMTALEEALIDQFRRQPSSRFQEVPGAARFLEALEESPDYGIAFATGATAGSARFKLEAAGIAVGGIPLASSSDAVVREHIMLQAMDRASERHRVVFSKITYFGDAAWDVEATDNLGWHLVGIGGGIETPIRFDDFTDPQSILEAL